MRAVGREGDRGRKRERESVFVPRGYNQEFFKTTKQLPKFLWAYDGPTPPLTDRSLWSNTSASAVWLVLLLFLPLPATPTVQYWWVLLGILAVFLG